MIKCQVCGFENPEDAAVCLNCGAPVEQQKMSEAIDDISEEQTIMLGQAPPSASPPEPPPMSPPPSPAVASPPPPTQDSAPRPESAPPPPPQMNQAPPPPPSPGMGPGGFQPQAGMPQGPPADMPNGVVYIVLGVLETLCCCMPLGVAGLIFAILGKASEGNGDYEKASSQYGTARLILIIGLVLGILINIVVLGLQFVAAAAESGNY